MVTERLDAYELAIKQRERYKINNAPRGDGYDTPDFKQKMLTHDLKVLTARALVEQLIQPR